MTGNTRTVFNQDNQGHITKKYPIFFGENLGMYDSVNIVNKKIEVLKELERAQNWFPTEVGLSQDRQDMLVTNKDTVDLMVKTITWQSMTDSIASRSVAALLSPYVTNSEADSAIAEWSRKEFVHAETYLHIIKQVMPNPDKVLLDAYADLRIRNRSEVLINTFDELYCLDHNLPLREKKKIMAKALCALMIMESVSFMASFAITFAIAETGVFQGIAEDVSMIAKDEINHSLISYEFIKACVNDDGWEDIFEEVKPEVQAILDAIVKSELEWTEYLFSDGRSVVGLTEDLIKDCVKFYAQTAYTVLKLDNPHGVIATNPCTYMGKYLDRSLVQYASQEINHGSYKQGAIFDDVESDLDLDFDI